LMGGLDNFASFHLLMKLRIRIKIGMNIQPRLRA